jgi:hypothetical protein
VSKGIDVVGWRGCKQQAELGPKRFVLTLKKIGRVAAEVRGQPVPSIPPLAVTPEQRRRLQVHQEQRQALSQFDAGTPECKECGLGGGAPYGCYTAIDFPIDVDGETALFRYFSAQLQDEKSPGAALYRDLVSKAPASGSAWHTDRGPGGDLAELEAPLVKEWGMLLWKKRVDSAQLLGSLFFNQRRIGLISAIATFWEGFVNDARAAGARFEDSATLKQLEALKELYDRVAEVGATMDGAQMLVESDAPSAGDKE